MLMGDIWLLDDFKTRIKTTFTFDLRKLLKCYNVKIIGVDFDENIILLKKIYRINKMKIEGEEMKVKFKIYEIDQVRIQIGYFIE